MNFWKDFCSSTGIRFFSYIFRSRSKSEAFFWISAFLLCVSVTTWDVIVTIKYFMESPTSTKVTVFINETFNLGQPTVCMYIGLNSSLAEKKLNLAETDGIQQFLNKFNRTDVQKFINDQFQKIKNPNFTEEKIASQEDFYKLVLLSATVLSNILRLELFIDKNFTTEQLAFGLTNLDIYETKSAHDLIDQSTELGIKLVYQFLIEQKFNFYELLKTVLSAICYLIRVKVAFNQVSPEDGREAEVSIPVCHENDMIWFGIEPFFRGHFDLLCMRLPDESVHFRLAYEYMRLSISKGSASLPMHEDFSEQNTIYFDLSGNQVSTTLDKNVLTLMEGSEHHITVQLSGHFKPLPSRKVSCSKQSKLDCLLKCRAEYIYRYCGCLPLFSVFIFSIRKVPLCRNSSNDSRDDFIIPGYNATLECRSIPMNSHPDGNCKNRCHSACDSKIYSYIKTREVKLDYPNQTMLVIKADPFTYPVYEDVYLQETKQLLGQLGGILSLWLGANFVVMLHTCFFVVSHVYFSRKPFPSEDSLETIAEKKMEQKLNRLIDMRLSIYQWDSRPR